MSCVSMMSKLLSPPDRHSRRVIEPRDVPPESELKLDENCVLVEKHPEIPKSLQCSVNPFEPELRLDLAVEPLAS